MESTCRRTWTHRAFAGFLRTEALWPLAMMAFLFTLSGYAKPPLDPTAIVRRGESQMRGQSAQALLTMKIERPSFQRDLKLRVSTEGRQNALVTILKPLKEEGITSLRTDSQMWNYLPKTDQTVRVPTSLMLQSWMGSDFTNDDLMKMSSLADDYTHRILKRERIKGHSTVLVECLPKPNAAVVWGKILRWARTSDNLPVREEYYDDQGKMVRTMELGDFRRMDDRVIPTEITIQKSGMPERTTVHYERILFDRLVDKVLFTRDRLRANSEKNTDVAQGWLTQRLMSRTVGT